jgi:ACT domain-containing protein
MKAKHRSWTGELIEVAAVFFAVGAAHLFVSLLGEHADGAAMLMASAAILIVGAAVRGWWTRHRHRSPDGGQRHAALHDLLAIPAAGHELIRLRTTLPDRPGTLAGLSGHLAARGINILAIQIHPSVDGAVDDLLVAAPRELTVADVTAAVGAGGGQHTEASRADLHDLVDPATRALTLAAETAADAGRLDGVLRALLSAEVTAERPPGAGHVARLRGPAAEPLFLTREAPAFTPVEVSRAQAMVDLCAAVRRPAGGHARWAASSADCNDCK